MSTQPSCEMTMCIPGDGDSGCKPVVLKSCGRVGRAQRRGIWLCSFCDGRWGMDMMRSPDTDEELRARHAYFRGYAQLAWSSRSKPHWRMRT